MSERRPVLLAFGLLLALRPGCGPFNPDKKENKPTHDVPKHCTDASSQCYDGCYKRQEGQLCGSCCFEQLILCDESKPYDISKCETVEREVRGR